MATMMLSVACSEAATGTSAGPIVGALYTVPSTLDLLVDEQWLDHPWPSDLRRLGGSPVFDGFYNPRGAAFVTKYLAATKKTLDGFSPVAPGYLRFDGSLDPNSLPADPGTALAADSAVQLVDIDPASPTNGQRHPIEVDFRAEPGVYLLANTLRWLPALGFPLRPATRYALVVSDAARGGKDEDVRASEELRQVLGVDPASGAAAELKAELAADVARLGELGIAADHIAQLAVFTTADPTRETFMLRDHVKETVDAPTVIDDKWTAYEQDSFHEYLGSYGPSPNYQHGEPPFSKSGGNFVFAQDEPELVSLFEVSFSLSVPHCTMPAAGYPLVLYAHGTGGKMRNYITRGIAAMLAEQCIAAMGVNQIFHGDRAGAPTKNYESETSLAFFNFENVVASRSNSRQSAIDEVQRARLFTETKAEIPAASSHTLEAIRFDPDKLMYLGHSQGGINEPIFFAVDDGAIGGVFSGAGAVMLVTLLDKVMPPGLLSVAGQYPSIFLGLTADERGEVDLFHPGSMLVQSLVDAIDTINYGRYHLLEPKWAPKSVLLTEGIRPDGSGDNWASPRGIEAHAIAIGLPLQLPAQRPYPQLDYGAPETVEIPPQGLSGNLASGAATGVLAQWAPQDGAEGHNVIFEVPDARAQVAGFLKSLAANPPGSVPPP